MAIKNAKVLRPDELIQPVGVMQDKAGVMTGGAASNPVGVKQPTRPGGGGSDGQGHHVDVPTSPTAPVAPTKPTYTSPYSDQINQMLNSLLNREQFNYNMNADPLYQQYKDQYIQGGRMAMMDTMGQAAALTGGYGNSYASTAGNQAYQQYLTGLNDKGMELRQLAYDMYNDEGNWMLNQLGMLNDAENSAYNRHRDEVNDYYTQQQLDYQRERDDIADEQWAIEHWRQIRNANKQNNKKKKKKKSSDDSGTSQDDERILNRL